MRVCPGRVKSGRSCESGSRTKRRETARGCGTFRFGSLMICMPKNMMSKSSVRGAFLLFVSRRLVIAGEALAPSKRSSEVERARRSSGMAANPADSQPGPFRSSATQLATKFQTSRPSCLSLNPACSSDHPCWSPRRCRPSNASQESQQDCDPFQSS